MAIFLLGAGMALSQNGSTVFHNGNANEYQNAPSIRAWPQPEYAGQAAPSWQTAILNTVSQEPQPVAQQIYINQGGIAASPTERQFATSTQRAFAVAAPQSTPQHLGPPLPQQTLMQSAPVPPGFDAAGALPPFAAVDNHQHFSQHNVTVEANTVTDTSQIPQYAYVSQEPSHNHPHNIGWQGQQQTGQQQTVVATAARLPMPMGAFAGQQADPLSPQQGLPTPVLPADGPLPIIPEDEIPYHEMPLEIPDQPRQVENAIPDFITPSEGYSIAQLQQMAMHSNPMLLKKQREIQATYGTWLQAGLYANPTIGFVGDDYADNGTQGKQGVSVSQEIVRGNKLGIARNVERWSIEIAKKEWEIAQVKVANDVKAFAWDYVLASYLVEANRALVQIAQESVQTSEHLVKINELGRNDLLQNRILLNRAKVELVKAEQDEQEKWQQLVAMVGQMNLPKMGITDSISHALFDIDLENIWQRLLAESPEIKLEQLKKRKADCVIAQEKAEAVPNITVGGTVSYHVSEKATVADFGVSMPLRIYDRNQGNIRRAQADAMAQGCETERVQLELRRRLSTEWNTYVKGSMVMEQYESSILIDAREGINLALRGARQEELGSLELLIAQQTYIQTLIEYINAVRDTAVSSTYIHGMLLKGGLDAN